MKNSRIEHRFSNREKLLMLAMAIILIVGLYFYLVHYPITKRMDEIDLEENDIRVQQAAADTRLQTYNDMKAELEEIFAMPEDQITVLPEYSNRENLLRYFDEIFQGVGPSLSYSQYRINGNVAEMTVSFSFRAADYQDAVSILTKLTKSGNRCLLSSISFSPGSNGLENTEGLGISGSITFYEHVSN